MFLQRKSLYVTDGNCGVPQGNIKVLSKGSSVLRLLWPTVWANQFQKADLLFFVSLERTVRNKDERIGFYDTRKLEWI